MNNITDPKKDWPEDFTQENGNYICECSICKECFIGYKRRVICKECFYSYDKKANIKFWLSIKHKNKCFFSRRNGLSGLLLFGYSIRLRLFNVEII